MKIIIFVFRVIIRVLRFIFSPSRPSKGEKDYPYIETKPTRPSKGRKDSPSIEIKPNKLLKVKVGHILDGDTVEVSYYANGTFRVRLYAIDCPENDQPWGKTAKLGLIKMIGGRNRNILLEVHGEDKYERTLATIHIEDPKDKSNLINVNERMVMLGHAWVMRKFYDDLSQDRQDQLNRLERWAKSKQVGLWKSDNPIPPWRWRHKQD